MTKVIDTLTQRLRLGPSRSCWNGTTSALQSDEITSEGSRVSCVYYHYKVHIRIKSGNLFNDPRISTFVGYFMPKLFLQKTAVILFSL